MSQLADAFEMSNKIDEFLSFQSKHTDLPIFLWGGGAACGYFLKFMKKYSIPVTGIIDKKKISGVKDKVRILTPEEAYTECEGAIVVISALAHKDEIMEEIDSKRYAFNTFYFDPTLEVLQQKSYEDRKNYFFKHEKELNDLKEGLIDRQSKIVFKNVIEGAITSNPECYKHSSSASQYFPKIIRDTLSENETFVDLGAFTGDSIEEFITVVNNKFEKVYAFEPDPANMHIAKENFCDTRIEFYQNGVGKEPDVLYLAGSDEAAHCVAVGNEDATKVGIVKLDDIIKEKVTYIKMDIEGMELDALRGVN